MQKKEWYCIRRIQMISKQTLYSLSNFGQTYECDMTTSKVILILIEKLLNLRQTLISCEKKHGIFNVWKFLSVLSHVKTSGKIIVYFQH